MTRTHNERRHHTIHAPQSGVILDAKHISLQYRRLERHYREALATKDPVSFLDLSHTLRIWVDMKGDIDDIIEQQGISLGLTNTTTPKSVKKMLKGSKYTYLPLGSGVSRPGIELKGVKIINRALSADEVKKLNDAGTPTAQPTSLRFSEWLASGVYGVPTEDETHRHLQISREILIKRIANVLGASHPAGTESADDKENRFDPYILDLHGLELADGYPATYYQLLEITGDILEAFKHLIPASA